MRQLMISLDKKILNKESAVARRMIEYGKTDELFILIPFQEKRHFDLSSTVHVWTTGGNRLIQYFRLKKIGLALMTENKIEEVTTQDPFFIGLVGVWLKKKIGVPLEVQLHGDFYSSNYYRQSGLKNLCQYHLGKYVMAQADHLRAVGERIRHSLVRLGIPPDRIIVRSIIIDSERIRRHRPITDLRQKYSAFKKIFLALGRLDPVKNIPWLVTLWPEVLKKYSAYGLLIVGTGQEEGRIRGLIDSFGIGKNVIMEPWTNEPWSYLKTADALVWPSVSEGYGLVVMEALAAGARVIMNNVGVAHYEIEPSAQVVILSVGDREGWKEAIK